MLRRLTVFSSSPPTARLCAKASSFCSFSSLLFTSTVSRSNSSATGTAKKKQKEILELKEKLAALETELKHAERNVVSIDKKNTTPSKTKKQELFAQLQEETSQKAKTLIELQKPVTKNANTIITNNTPSLAPQRKKKLTKKSITKTDPSRVPPSNLNDFEPYTKLSAEQKKYFEMAINTDNNLFITGGAGSGKTFLIKTIIEYLNRYDHRLHPLSKKRTRKSMENLSYNNTGTQVRVIAPTGVAALNAGGLTLHTFLGLSPGDVQNRDTVHRKASMNKAKFLMRRFGMQLVRTIIIDEISMVTPTMLKALEDSCREFYGFDSSKPFGGIQIIVCGDFLQLPPVFSRNDQEFVRSIEQMQKKKKQAEEEKKQTNLRNDDDCEVKNDFGGYRVVEAEEDSNEENIASLYVDELMQKYCFQTAAWEDANFVRCDLTYSFRHLQQAHREGGEFLEFLSTARFGSPNSTYMLRKLSHKLHSKKKTFGYDNYNAQQQAQQQQEQPRPQDDNDNLIVRIRATNKEVDWINTREYDIVTKKNLSSRADTSTSPIDQKSNEEIVSCPSFEAKYVSEVTGAAAKQGSSYNDSIIAKEIRLQRGTKVMLLKNINVAKGLVNGRLGTVVGFETNRLEVIAKHQASLVTVTPNTINVKAVATQQIANYNTLEVYPIVEFPTTNDETANNKNNNSSSNNPTPPLRVVITPQVWEIQVGTEIVGSITQLPLRHAWAITAHKSQGLTLDRVEVDLTRFFDHGQGYVALSRAKNIDGLSVIGIDRARNAVRACPTAIEFQKVE